MMGRSKGRGVGLDRPRSPSPPGGTALAGPAAVFARCARLLLAGDPEAGAVLGRCLADHPADAAGWTTLGEALVRLGKPEAALVCLERSGRAAPSSAVSLRIGSLLQGLGRAAAARAAFAEAAALDPASVRARFLEGVAAQDAGDFAGAARAYEAALALDPRLGEAALNLGTVRQEAGDVAGARRAYGRAVRLRPDSFGRAAQALTTARSGELWLDLGALRRTLDDGA